MIAVKQKPFGAMPGGDPIDLYTMTNARGTQASVITYGARLVSFAPLVNGQPRDIVLGYDTANDYLADHAYMGAIIGRHANAIAGGRVFLGGHMYQLEQNAGAKRQNHIHGGTRGLHAQLWTAEIIASGVVLTVISPDGEGGYPGNFEAKVTYRLTDDDALIISYRATSDADTICNLTNHAYFNLDGSATIEDHTAEIYADAFTWADADALPDGRILSVAGTPMDFTTPHRIGARIDADHDQLRMAGGYDHNFVLRGDPAPAPYSHLKNAARVASERSGLALSCYTTQPGMQFYTGNNLAKEQLFGKGDTEIMRRGGLCLQTQFFPNALAHPHFPQPVLRMDETYEAETVYQLKRI